MQQLLFLYFLLLLFAFLCSTENEIQVPSCSGVLSFKRSVHITVIIN